MNPFSQPDVALFLGVLDLSVEQGTFKVLSRSRHLGFAFVPCTELH